MLVMTARVDRKKIALVLTAIVALIVLLVALLGGKKAAETAMTEPSVGTNDGRVSFLKQFGWEVDNSPTQSSQVRIPEESSEVYTRYNALQKSQGYDLTNYAGKSVMRYVYQITNYPDSKEPVYATLLIYKNQVIGGDVTNTSANGSVHGFRMPEKATS